LKLLRVARDGDVIADAREAAAAVLADDPRLDGHPALAADVRRRLDDDATGFLSKG
jgi:ATP-dependent DNA helicase RecG